MKIARCGHKPPASSYDYEIRHDRVSDETWEAPQENIMSIKVGERVPDATLSEFFETETEACSVGPNNFQVADLVKGKTIALFAVPGAFTPTCSNKHLPGYLELSDQIKAKGVDEIWCVSVNDPFVMGAWGRDQGVAGRVRMLGDGSANWTRKLGLEMDLSARGLGVRSQRYSAILKDGVVKQLNLEGSGEFKVSDAATLLGQL
jgi:peroxiredoxin